MRSIVGYTFVILSFALNNHKRGYNESLALTAVVTATTTATKDNYKGKDATATRVVGRTASATTEQEDKYPNQAIATATATIAGIGSVVVTTITKRIHICKTSL